MLFTQRILDGIKSGDVTLAFRRWRRRPPKPGATLRTAIGVITIDRVDELDDADISLEDARRSGEVSLAALLATLGGEGRLYRMRVRLSGDDPRVALRETRPTAEEIAAVTAKLARLDARADAPWTARWLSIVREQPATLSHSLARQVGQDTPTFKRRMRALKELGLTESLEVGYRLSPRGEDVLRALDTE